MTYDIIENIIWQINSSHDQISREIRSYWSKGTVIDKNESVVWNQNKLAEHNGAIDRKIKSIRSEIANLKAELNNSFEKLIAEVLNCSEDTASNLYCYIVEIAEDIHRESDNELERRLEYTRKLLDILANDSKPEGV